MKAKERNHTPWKWGKDKGTLLREKENDAQRIDWEERAAIMEYDGGLSRADAERLAREDMEKWREE
jgi:hypothetical protein